MVRKKPIIGLAGGIGSGKTLVARQLESLGAVVFDADQVAKAQYQREDVQQQLVEWWGNDVLTQDGQVNLSAVASIVFDHQDERSKLEGLIHPIVAQARVEFVDQAMADPAIKAVVLDVPLLFEVGLHENCDSVIYVDCDLKIRQSRVMARRGWDADELKRREKTQWPLDKKRRTADYIVTNSSSEDQCLTQVQDVFHRILDHHR